MAQHSVIVEDFSGGVLTGLAPAFTLFRLQRTGDALTPPSITEDGNGFYGFSYSPSEPVQFEVDAGATVTDLRLRFIRGVLEPDAIGVASDVSEILALLREDLRFEESGGETFQVLYVNDVALRKWKVTNQDGQSVAWPSTSRLPVNRERVL